MDLITKNKEALIASCDKILDTALDSIHQLSIENFGTVEDTEKSSLQVEDFQKTVDRVQVIKNKIINDEEFSKFDLIMLHTIMTTNHMILSQYAQRFQDAAGFMEGLIEELVKIIQNFDS
jgi:hypothetical protein